MLKTLRLSAILLTFATLAQAQQTLRATVYDSHFTETARGGEAWNGITIAKDGTVYYVLSSPAYNVPATMYSLDPKTKKITAISNLKPRLLRRRSGQALLLHAPRLLRAR